LISWELRERRPAANYYKAQIQKAGGEMIEIKVAEDGKLIGVGKEEKEDGDND
jgi:hypothetical protein